MKVTLQTQHCRNEVALAEWLRRVPAKYMGFPRESSNLSGDDLLSLFFPTRLTLNLHFFYFSVCVILFIVMLLSES